LNHIVNLISHIWHFFWPYGITVLVLVILFVIILRIERKRIQLKHELRIQRLQNEKLTEVDQLKSRFFANLSHEFRTLLTLISGPLDLIKHNIDETVIRQNLPLRPYEQIKRKINQEAARKNYQIIQNNARLLNRLIAQLLDLSRLDTGHLALRTKPVEIVSTLRNIVHAFLPYAQNQEIELSFQSEQEALFAYIDMDKFEIILNNLISNAIKFTPSGGCISVSIDRTNDCLTIHDKQVDCFEIQICDSGVGIPQDQLEKIFDRFVQINPEKANVKEGMGIGLSLTKELTELHYGKISVTSIPEEGTIFTVRLPIGKEHLKESEIVAEYIKMADMNESREEFAKTLHNPKKKDQTLPLVLIVEDNPEMRYFIRSCLDSLFQVEEARNGKEAIDATIKLMPDIIISDIMMPEMDGITFCRKLREDNRVNHIPMIFLTAKAEDRDKIEGFESGADEYVVKPFNAHELNARIKNLMKQRNLLRDKIQKDFMIEPDSSGSLSMDEQFIQKAREIIQVHIDDTEYSVESFASDMAMSRFHLNRKLQHVLGMGPSRLIREIRLRKAAQLIQSKTGNISEIALDVGFDNFAYFNRCFKEKYGCSPSKYLLQKTDLSNSKGG